jgi:Uma2 family endonuclease
MATAAATARLRLGARSAGILLTPEEFDAALFRRGPRYELINGVLVVSPSPMKQERDPNGYFGYLLRKYEEEHPEGHSLNLTLSEETIHSTPNRRRADRVIWAGLGRLPLEDDPPTIIVEFVSKGRAARERDHITKRVEYGMIGTREYVIVDRFQRTMTVVDYSQPDAAPRVLGEKDTYTTPLLPGFALPVARLFALADRWDKREE